MRTAEEIREEAQSVFPKDVLNGLEQWYRGMLDGTWRYVVFVTERSYLLALAMERMTGESMDDCESEFLTGEGFSLRYGEIAKTYERIGTFPKILLCDDVMDYGREMNHFICCTQDAVCRCLGGKADATEICKNLAQMTRIWIYARADTGSILMGRYVRKFVSAETGEKKTEASLLWRQEEKRQDSATNMHTIPCGFCMHPISHVQGRCIQKGFRQSRKIVSSACWKAVGTDS